MPCFSISFSIQKRAGYGDAWERKLILISNDIWFQLRDATVAGVPMCAIEYKIFNGQSIYNLYIAYNVSIYLVHDTRLCAIDHKRVREHDTSKWVSWNCLVPLYFFVKICKAVNSNQNVLQKCVPKGLFSFIGSNDILFIHVIHYWWSQLLKQIWKEWCQQWRTNVFSSACVLF